MHRVAEQAPPAADEPTTQPLEFWAQPECSINWSISVLTPEMAAAWAAAQSAAQTVDKDAHNQDKGYRYAGADSLVREARRALSSVGLALVMSWRAFDRPWEKVSANQWIDWRLVCDWMVMHGSATADGRTARLCGTAEIVAIGSAGRPPDKSLLAARTTLAGAVAMSLVALDRSDPGDEDVSSRQEPDTHVPPRRRLTDEGRAIADAALRQLYQLRRNAGHQHEGKPITMARVLLDLMGEGFAVRSDEDAQAVADAAKQTFASIHAAHLNATTKDTP